MNEYAQILNFLYKSKELDSEKLVSILLLISQRLDIDTISETARKEGKTPAGIRFSNNYRKVNIGKQLFAVTGLKNSELPF